MVATLAQLCSVFQTAYHHKGAAFDIEFLAAFGVGVEGDFGGAGGGDGINHAAVYVHVAVGIESVVSSCVSPCQSASYGEVGRRVDGVVGRRSAVNNSARDGDFALAFYSFVRAAANADVAARKHYVAVEFDALGGDTVVALLLSRTREAATRRAEVGARDVHRKGAAAELCDAVAADALGACAAAVEGDGAAHEVKALLAFHAGGFQRVAVRYFGRAGRVDIYPSFEDFQIFVAYDAALAFGSDVKSTAATKNKLALTKNNTLLVLL